MNGRNRIARRAQTTTNPTIASSASTKSTNICAKIPSSARIQYASDVCCSREIAPDISEDMTRPLSLGKSAAVLIALAAMTACRSARTIKLEWDAPPVSPDGYRILVDDRVVTTIPPPPVDASCRCVRASVPVERGRHTVKVVAYNAAGDSPPSAVAVIE